MLMPPHPVEITKLMLMPPHPVEITKLMLMPPHPIEIAIRESLNIQCLRAPRFKLRYVTTQQGYGYVMACRHFHFPPSESHLKFRMSGSWNNAKSTVTVTVSRPMQIIVFVHVNLMYIMIEGL